MSPRLMALALLASLRVCFFLFFPGSKGCMQHLIHRRRRGCSRCVFFFFSFLRGIINGYNIEEAPFFPRVRLDRGVLLTRPDLRISRPTRSRVCTVREWGVFQNGRTCWAYAKLLSYPQTPRFRASSPKRRLPTWVFSQGQNSRQQGKGEGGAQKH